MKRMAFTALCCLLLVGCEQQPAGEPVMRTEIGKGSQEMTAARKARSDCEVAIFEEVPLTHCIADPEKHQIRTALNAADGTPYRSLRAYAKSLGNDVLGIAFAVNAGMFDGQGKPVGYYVEDSERLVELNRNDGPGNFHMKPNGVFYGSDDKWQIKTADSFYSTVGDRPKFGTQSGPMLVINGQLHPGIQDDGPSKAVRNGVGIDAAGRAHFVISEGPLSFGQFARYFRDELKTPNALFLDGGVSALWDPQTERLDPSPALGPLIVVSTKE